jgi:hypothetical protein
MPSIVDRGQLLLDVVRAIVRLPVPLSTTLRGATKPSVPLGTTLRVATLLDMPILTAPTDMPPGLPKVVMLPILTTTAPIATAAVDTAPTTRLPTTTLLVPMLKLGVGPSLEARKLE